MTLPLVIGLALELHNAALEALIDRVHPALHPDIGASKDMSSAGVFLVNLVALGAFAACLVAHAGGKGS